jgi:ABC-type Fe3+-siderophore transport system permease subunit
MSTTNPSNWIDEETTTLRAAARVGSTAVKPVRAAAFWLAVVLPFAYLPLLAGGFGGESELLTFVGLVAANAVALLVGHDHRR